MSWNISRVNYYGNKCVVMGINECHVNFLSSWSHMMHFHLVRFAGACLPAVWRSKLHPKPQLPPHTLASWLPGRLSAFFAACHSPTCSLSMLNRHHEGMDFTHPLPETCRQTKEQKTCPSVQPQVLFAIFLPCVAILGVSLVCVTCACEPVRVCVVAMTTQRDPTHLLASCVHPSCLSSPVMCVVLMCVCRLCLWLCGKAVLCFSSCVQYQHPAHSLIKPHFLHSLGKYRTVGYSLSGDLSHGAFLFSQKKSLVVGLHAKLYLQSVGPNAFLAATPST